MLELMISLLDPSVLLVIIATLLLVLYVRQTPRWLNMPPGPFPLPILGNFLEFLKDPGTDIHIFSTLAKKYGKLCSLKLGFTNTLIINDYNLLMEAFVKNSDVFSNRPIEEFYLLKYTNEKIGPGIVSNHGHSWKQLRRTTLVAMRDFGVGKQSLEEKVQEEIAVLLDCFGKTEGEPIYAKPLFNTATSNVICGVIFGSRFDYRDEKFKKLLKSLEQSLAINPLIIPSNYFPVLRHIPFIHQMADDFVGTMMATIDHIKELTASNEATYDPNNIRHFVDLFIKMKKENSKDDSFNETNVRRAIVDLFTAGSDTTANTLAWLMLYMAKYPDIQNKCQEEIDQVVGKGKRVSQTDRDNLKYVEATILETLRVRPAAPVGVPHCTSKDIQLGGYFIPKNTLTFSNLLVINNDPVTFPEPDKFKPEHFLDENGKIINREKMVAFSVGPRVCLGESLARMEVALFFTSILQFYTITPETGKPMNLSPDAAFLMHIKPEKVVFTRRD